MFSTSRRCFAASSTTLLLLLLNVLTGCASTGNTPTSNPSAGGPPTPFTFPTDTPPPEWQIYHDPQFGFSVEVPGILRPVVGGGSHPNSSGISYQYDFTNGTPPAGAAAAAEMVVVIYATTIGPNSCTIGVPTTIGQSVTAYVQNDLFTKSRPAGDIFPLAARILSGGVFIEIQVTGQAKPADFMARYGAIWQHILDSFVPGPPVPNTHPCG